MAHFINKRVEVTNAHIAKSVDNNYSTYSTFLEAAPVFITYYKQSEIESMTDVGFGNRASKFGSDSPIRYNKIINLPLFIDPAQLNIENDEETGITLSWETEGVILPNTILPIADDVLEIPHLKANFLFKVIEVTTDYIKSNKYFKIRFKLDREVPDNFKNLVSEEYTCIYDNIGTTDKCIIKKDSFENLINIDTVLDVMRKKYISVFYNPDADIPVAVGHNSIITDPYLIEFTRRNKLFETKDMSSMRFNHYMPISTAFNRIYTNTVFFRVEKRSKKAFNTLCRYVKPSYDSCYLTSSGRSTREVDYFDNRGFLKEEVFDKSPLFGTSLTIENIEKCEMVNDDEPVNGFMVNVIIMYINNKPDLEIVKYITTYMDDNEVYFDNNIGELYIGTIFIKILLALTISMVSGEVDLKL